MTIGETYNPGKQRRGEQPQVALERMKKIEIDNLRSSYDAKIKEVGESFHKLQDIEAALEAARIQIPKDLKTQLKQTGQETFVQVGAAGETATADDYQRANDQNVLLIEKRDRLWAKLNKLAQVEDLRKKEVKEQVEGAIVWFQEEKAKVERNEESKPIPREINDLLEPTKLALLGKEVAAKIIRARDNLEQAKKKFEIKAAQDKLKMAHQWLDGIEKKLKPVQVLSKEEVTKLRSEFLQSILENTNQVKQARDFIQAKNLAVNVEVQPENNRLEERWQEMNERIKVLDQERLKKELADGLAEAQKFVEDLAKGPAEEEYDTLEKRQGAWQLLERELRGVLDELRVITTDPKIEKELHERIVKMNELLDINIPEALASAALAISETSLWEKDDGLKKINTLGDLTKQINNYIAQAKQRGTPETQLPDVKFKTDESIDEWLGRFVEDSLGEAEKVLEYCRTTDITNQQNQEVTKIEEHPVYTTLVARLKDAIAKLKKTREESFERLKLAKHRESVKKAVTAEAVQEGEAKLAMFRKPEAGEAERLDIEKIKGEQIWSQVINVLLTQHTFFGHEKKAGGLSAEAGERVIIDMLVRKFGPGIGHDLTPVQCEDLFYAAKAWLYDRAVADKTKAPRQAMPEAATEGGAAAAPQAGAPLSRWQRWKGTIAQSLGWMGLGVGLTEGAKRLGHEVWEGVAAFGGLRLIDCVRHHVVEWRDLNRWKDARKKEGVESEFYKALTEHLSFTVVNLRENNLRRREDQERRQQGAPVEKDYQFYYNNVLRSLNQENDRREERGEDPWSDAEKEQIAAAHAIFYARDDQVERERLGGELNRSPNARRWWMYVDVVLGQAVRGGRLGKGWQLSSAPRRLIGGSAWMGLSFGLLAAGANTLPFIRQAMRALAGWKMGGALVDIWAGKKAPENVVEENLTKLERELGQLGSQTSGQLGAKVQELSGCWASLSSISNPVEYARQKERLKKVLMPVMVEKVLKAAEEHAAKQRELPEKKRLGFVAEAIGERETGEVSGFYEGIRRGQAAGEESMYLKRLGGRAAGAITVMLLGEVAERILGYFAERGQVHIEKTHQGPEPQPPSPPTGEPVQPGGEPPPVEAGVGPTAPPVEPQPPEEISAAAVVGKGEGVSHAFRDQLKADPQRWGFPGDIKSAEGQRWLDNTVIKLLKEFDYTRGGRMETRVGLVNQVAYVLKGDMAHHTVQEVLVHQDQPGHFVAEQSGPVRGAGAPETIEKEYEYSHRKIRLPAQEITGTAPEAPAAGEEAITRPARPTGSLAQKMEEEFPRTRAGREAETRAGPPAVRQYITEQALGAEYHPPAGYHELSAAPIGDHHLVAPDDYDWQKVAQDHWALLQEKARAAEDLVNQYANNAALSDDAQEVKAEVMREIDSFAGKVQAGQSLKGIEVLKQGVNLGDYYNDAHVKLEAEMWKHQALDQVAAVMGKVGAGAPPPEVIKTLTGQFLNDSLNYQDRLIALRALLPGASASAPHELNGIDFWPEGGKIHFETPSTMGQAEVSDVVSKKNLDLLVQFGEKWDSPVKDYGAINKLLGQLETIKSKK